MTEGSKRRRFRQPPIEEVAMGVQFAPLDLSSAKLGTLWHLHFRERFPNVQDHQPLAHVVERFAPASPPKFGIKLLTEPPPPTLRAWFLSEDLHELCQVQPDRFVRNWRKVEGQGTYPRYHVLREAFEQDLARFEAGLEELGPGPLQIDQCELTYVDHLPVGKELAGVSELEKAVTVWSWPKATDGLRPEEARFKATFVMEDAEADAFGRVHLELRPGVRRSDNTPLLVLQTIARGKPRGEGTAGVLAFLDRAHAMIVELFLAMTTDDMHAVWGRYDDDV